jgi:hypothetical protein
MWHNKITNRHPKNEENSLYISDNTTKTTNRGTHKQSRRQKSKKTKKQNGPNHAPITPLSLKTLKKSSKKLRIIQKPDQNTIKNELTVHFRQRCVSMMYRSP